MKKILFLLLCSLLSALGADAEVEPDVTVESYAEYTAANTMLTFYCDDMRAARTGTTYDLNTGDDAPDWQIDGIGQSVSHVVFDPSFVNACPTSTVEWFSAMKNLTSITGLNYLNTSNVTNMSAMFARCESLTSLELGSFNTIGVTKMDDMFNGCLNLTTVGVRRGWTTAAVTSSSDMFNGCVSLVGGKGTTYDASHVDKAYAHIDGGTVNPGYFSNSTAGNLMGDVNCDGRVDISDTTAVIELLLGGGTAPSTADSNQDCNVDISDVTALIDYLLSGIWE